MTELFATFACHFYLLFIYLCCPAAGDPDPGAYADGAAEGHPAPQGQNTGGGEAYNKQGRNQVHII